MVDQDDDDMMGAQGRAGADGAGPRAHDALPEVAVLEGIAAELDDVEVALQRLDDGSYGRCERCGDPIDDERLAARPATRTCAAHRVDERNG